MKRNIYKAKWVGILILSILLIAAGCGKTNSGPNNTSSSENDSASANKANVSTTNGDTAAATTDKLKIGFSFGQSVHPFFIAMEKGAREAAANNNVELFVTSANYKLENQLANVEDLMQKGVKAILLNPIDSKAFTNVVNSAREKKIGVITVDIGVLGAETTSHIASDNKGIGKLAAQYIANKLNKRGKVAYISDQSVTSLLDREAGFKEEIAKYPDIKIVAAQSGAVERAKALESAENILQANPDIDAFFGVNESSAMGELSALQARNLTKPFIVGVDATPDLLKSINSSTNITATIAQDPYMMGKKAVETAIAFAKGEQVEKLIPVLTEVVTKENVAKYIEREDQYKK